MIELDGSRGEGGGQILRSALALSILTRRNFRLVNIRANRPNPGLAAQHLACVRAAAAICGGHYKGGSIGSSTLFFEPGEVKAGHYTFSIGTAGATALVLHTVYLPLALLGKKDSTVTITGGTHAIAAPCFDFLESTWLHYLRRLGLDISVTLTRHGFYPRGGGEIRAMIRPAASSIRGFKLTERAELTTAGGFAATADLPENVRTRIIRRLKHRLKQEGIESEIRPLEWSNGPAAVAGVTFLQAPVPPLFFAIGERSKPSEVVADEAADEAIAYRNSGAPVDPHSADQLVLPLAFAASDSLFRVSEVTRHLLTNIDTIKEFVSQEEMTIMCEGLLGQVGTVRVVRRHVSANINNSVAGV